MGLITYSRSCIIVLIMFHGNLFWMFRSVLEHIEFYDFLVFDIASGPFVCFNEFEVFERSQCCILLTLYCFYNCFVKTDLGAFGNPRTMKFNDFQAFDFAMFYCVVFKIPMCWNDHKEQSY